MPKISNKGFGFLPVLLLSLLVGVLSLIGYKFYTSDSDNVLQMKSSISTKNQSNGYDVELTYIGSDKYQTGKIVLILTNRGEVIHESVRNFSTILRTSGVIVEEFCVTAVCPKSKIVKPSVKSINRGLQFEIPVTPLVKKISFDAGKSIDANLESSWDNSGVTNMWVVGTEGLNRFEILRKNQPTTIGVYLRSANSSRGQENYEVYINGIGDDTAELIRTIRTSGISRMDMVGSNLRTVVLKPAVTYANGQGRFNITALNNTRTFYVNSSRKLNMDINPIPAGWVKNKNGDGIDRVALETLADITFAASPWQYPSYNQEIDLIIRRANKPFIDTFNKNGMLIVNNYGSTRKLSLKISPDGYLKTRITLNIVKTQKLVFVNLIAEGGREYLQSNYDGGNYWELIPNTEGGGIKRGSRDSDLGILKKPSANVTFSTNALQYPSYNQKIYLTIRGANKPFIDTFNKNGMLIVNNDGSTRKLSLKISPNGNLETFITLNLLKTQKLVFVNLIPVGEQTYLQPDYDGGNDWELIPYTEGGGIKRGSSKYKFNLFK